MIIREENLIELNSKNKIQRVVLQLDQDTASDTFIINRITSQLGGKERNQPPILINFSKQKRNIAEQATLKFNSLLKNYQDKGYKVLSSLTSIPFNKLTEQDLFNLLGTTVTDSANIPKPMLCKLADDCVTSIFEKSWYCSKKIDGCRCLLYFKDGEIHSASRGGNCYDSATIHIRTNPQLIQFFIDHPDIILDGELYKHSITFPLQKISGLCRLETPTEECKELEYWIYDYISSEPFSARYENLMEWKEVLSNPIFIMDHILLSGYYKIKREHDRYVQEGFEGLVMRNPNKEYGINRRSALYMVKMKERKSAEFKIVGVKEGMRPEDMCFILVTNSGIEFAAKPIGPAEMRLEYLYNAGNFIGKMATCTFFNYTRDGVPSQPVFQHVRPEGE